MARRLPRAHPDDDEAVRKLRLRVFKLFYQSYYEWESLRKAGLITIDTVLAPNGEEIYFPDMMTGYAYLPRRQQQAFELICMRSYSEAAATIEIYGEAERLLDDDGNPKLDADGNPVVRKRSSTVVQQYAQQALERMVEAYDEVQSGTWDPIAVMNSRKLNGRVIKHDSAAARRNRRIAAAAASGDELRPGGQGRRAAGQVPGDLQDDRGEDRVLHRGPNEAARGARGVQRVRTG
jgi:hypothetical protein